MVRISSSLAFCVWMGGGVGAGGTTNLLTFLTGSVRDSVIFFFFAKFPVISTVSLLVCPFMTKEKYLVIS